MATVLLIGAISVILLPLSSDGQCTGDAKPGGAASWNSIVNPPTTTPYCTHQDRLDPTMSAGRVGALVSSHWVRCQLLSGFSKRLMVFDTSFGASSDGHSKYLSEGHIPAAQFFSMNQCVKPAPTCARNFPETDCFKDYLKTLGIRKDSHVVFYDGAGMMTAARAWWTLRAFGFDQVSILDGGFKQWQEDGNDVSYVEDAPFLEDGDVSYNIKRDLIVHFDDMVKIVETGSHQIIDTRKAENFYGEEAEPTPSTCGALDGMAQPIPDMMHCGHMPGAINLEANTVINPSTRLLRDKEKLKKIFAAHGIDLNRPITTLCYNGNLASLVALAFHEAGKEDVSVYYGSWTEWGQKANSEYCTRSRPSYRHG